MAFEAFKGCEFPPLDWVVHSAGRSGAFWPRDAEVAGNHLFVVGDFRSVDPDDIEENNPTENYFLTGPFTKDDKSGLLQTSNVNETVLFQQEGSGEGRTHDYEIGIQVIDTVKGVPIDVLHFKSFHNEATFSIGATALEDGTSHLGVGGTFTGSASFPETIICTPFQSGDASITCADIPDNAGTPYSTELAISSIDPGDIPLDSGYVPTYGFSSYLLGLQTNNASTDDWSGLTVKWVTIPWHGSYTARVHGVVVDPTNGNVLAGGEACDGTVGEKDPDLCSGWVGMFNATDGAPLWKREFEGYGRIYNVEIDAGNSLVFFTGHNSFTDDGLMVTGCISAIDGSTIWSRSIDGIGRPSAVTFNGEVKLAKEEDGPYVYAAHSVDNAKGGLLDVGTPYAACLDTSTNTKIPSYEVVTDKLLSLEDCTSRGYTFIPSTSDDAIQASEASTGVICGTKTTEGVPGFPSCILKYHKFTGLPKWSNEVVQTRGMETSPDGPLITGPYKPSRGSFSGIRLSDTGDNIIYQALLDKDTGKGIYVQSYFDESVNTHTNGAAQDSDGNMYLITTSFATKLFVGSEGYTLKFPASPDNTKSGSQYHLLVLKVLTGSGNTPVVPDCLVCNMQGFMTAIKDDNCYVDQVCFEDGSLATPLLGKDGLLCDSSESQTGFQNLGDEPDDPTCDVCGEGNIMTNNDAMFDASAFGFGQVQCGMIDAMGKAGTLPQVPGVTCATFALLLAESCGCVAKTDSPTQAPTDSPTFPEGDGSDGICFSGENTVEVLNKGIVSMKSIKIGDSVRVQGGKFSKVYSFGHYDNNVLSKYMQVHMSGTKNLLEVSEKHMVFVQNDKDTTNKFFPAENLKVGDILISENGLSEVLKINTVFRKGAYAPFTNSGDIIVSGVVASNYISIIPDEELGLPVTMQWVAHTFNAPHRMFCSILPNFCENETYIDGLSRWIYAPYHTSNWLAQQSNFVKRTGSTILIASMFGIPLIISVLTLRIFKKKLNK